MDYIKLLWDVFDCDKAVKLITDLLSWQLVTLSIVIYFRNNIKDLLASLKLVSKIKFGDIEISLSEYKEQMNRLSRNIAIEFSNKEILWVDDEPENIKLLCQIFKLNHNNVDISLNTMNALKKINNKKYDIIISDMYRFTDGCEAGKLFFKSLEEQNKSYYSEVKKYIFCGKYNANKYRDSLPDDIKITSNDIELIYFIIEDFRSKR